MDEKLREQCLENISDYRAVDLYDALCREYADMYGEVTRSAQHLIGDIATMEEQKLALNADIAKRGVTEEFRNGRQHFFRENKSIAVARMLTDQQRRLLNELKLTPSGRKAAADDGGDAFNEF